MIEPSTSRVFPNVEFGPGVVIGDFCVIGQPARDRGPGEDVVVIGEDAVIRSHTVIYGDVRIGRRFQTGHGTLIREHTVIGDDCSVGSGAVVEFSVVIGDGVRLHSRCFVPEHSILEDGSWLGPGVVLTNARFPGSRRAKENLEGVRVGARARVGANATILPGITIGPESLVGAGSVVTRDVDAGTVVIGNPSRRVGLVADLKDGNGQAYELGSP